MVGSWLPTVVNSLARPPGSTGEECFLVNQEHPMLKAGFIGAGDRAVLVHMPIIQRLKGVEMSGSARSTRSVSGGLPRPLPSTGSTMTIRKCWRERISTSSTALCTNGVLDVPLLLDTLAAAGHPEPLSVHAEYRSHFPTE